METYLEADVGEELCKHLFLSFNKNTHKEPSPNTTTGTIGRDFNVKDVAVVASQTVCAPITHQSTEIHVDRSQERSGIAEKIHGITEKFHSLGHGSDKGWLTVVNFLANFGKKLVYVVLKNVLKFLANICEMLVNVVLIVS